MAKAVKFDIRAQNKSKTAFNSIKSDLRGLTKSLGGLKTLAVGMAAGAAGIYALSKGIQTVTSAAMVQRDAEAKLGAVLKATGNAAGFTLEQLKGMASGLQEVTTFGDETTLSAMAMLATFKNIKGESFKRATVAAMDLSISMAKISGGAPDLQNAMLLLGKALNDPVKGLGALSRNGIAFTEAQVAMIEKMVETGDIMGAQSIIFAELEGQTGGLAEALGDTFAGKLAQLKGAWGDLLEQVGFAIVDNKAIKAILVEVKEIIQDLTPFVVELVAKFAAWIGPADQLRNKLEVFMKTVKAMIAPLKLLWKLMQLVGKGIGVGAAMAVGGAESVGAGMHATAAWADSVSGYQTGTGAAGLPSDGLFYGHKGEIVLNPAQSDNARGGGGGGNTYHFHLETMVADPTSLRNAAQIFKREIGALDARWGTT